MMATECSRDAIQRFLAERGGRVPHADLTRHFRRLFPEDDPPLRRALREAFKTHVDAVACVRVDGGVRLVCLRKRYMRAPAAGEEADRCVATGDGTRAAVPAPADLLCARRDGDAAASPPLRARGAAMPRRSSDYGNDDSEVSAPPVPHVHTPATAAEPSNTVDARDAESDMGHRWSSHGGRTGSTERRARDAPPPPPRITVIGASPLPVAGDGSVFVLPGGAPPGSATPDESPQAQRLRRGLAPEDGGGGGGGGGGGDPSDPATDPSPQTLRSLAQRNASFLSARHSDTASLASSNGGDDDGTSSTSSSSAAALDPLEHEWMMCASDGVWERLQTLLAGEPSLVQRKDFVTGFNLLHWAAKRGDPELLALAVSFAKRRGVPVDVNARSSCGYTPLHLAAMHGHLEVVKLLVGAYDADVEVRDYGGKKAGQYLANGATLDIRDIIGAFDDDGGGEADGREEGARWSFLPHLRPHLRVPGEGEGGGRARVKPLRTMSSLGRVKPRLQKLRDRTSQIVHSASFRELGTGPVRPRSEFIPGRESPH